MIGIKLADVRQVNGFYWIQVRGKKNKYRTIKLNESLYLYIRDTFNGKVYLFETQNCKPYTRTYVSGEIKKIGKRILHRSISAHVMRHSFATWKVRKGCSIDAVADYLGHSSPVITLLMYSHNSMDDSDLPDER